MLARTGLLRSVPDAGRRGLGASWQVVGDVADMGDRGRRLQSRRRPSLHRSGRQEVVLADISSDADRVQDQRHLVINPHLSRKSPHS